MQTEIVLLGIALLTIAAYGDISTFTIPNALAVAVAVLGVLRLIVIGDLSAALYTVGVAALVFVVTFLMFWRGLLGGGDVKLLSATILLVGYHDLVSFLLIMGICGALVAVAVLAIHSVPLWLGPRLAAVVPKPRLAVPYGVAIAAAGIVTLFLQTSYLG